MERLRSWLRNQKQRRQLITITSGGLILFGLAAGLLLDRPGLQNGLMAAAALIAGWDIALRAWQSLRNRYVSIELLVTIAAGGAMLIGEYWEAAAVTFLFVLGAYLEARTLSQTRQVLQGLLDLVPTTAVLLRDGQMVEVQPGEVPQGAIVLVRPGAKIAVDGEVLDGRSAVDESTITGEPMPAEKGAGSPVYAGTVNQNGLLKVRATGVGEDTTLARIIRRVEEAQEEKAPTQRFIERFAHWYTPAIIGLSGLAFLLTRDVELALTLLVIGCPGALVISTPVSVVAGIGRAARGGILVKGGEYLENSGKISALALDKTGTLTQGKPCLTGIIPLQPVAASAGMGPDRDRVIEPIKEIAHSRWSLEQLEVLYWAAIAEAGSEHPLARAVLAEGETVLGRIPQPDDFEALTGLGVRASYQNHEILAGKPEWVQEQGIQVFPAAQDAPDSVSSSGETAILVAVDKILLGVLRIADPIREDAREMVRRLEASGVQRILMLTGDNQLTAQVIAAQAGIHEVHAGLLPHDKLEIIRKLQRQGHVVAMAGDGINDAPALAAADIGIAMGAGGTDIAIETADIALISTSLLKIPEAIRVSKATLGNIRQNVIIALASVTVLLLGVLAGRVHMAGGMLVHQASVLIVILNGMRLLRIRYNSREANEVTVIRG